MKLNGVAISIILIGLFVGGCSTTTITNPPRSATEQLLLSTSTDRALAMADLTMFAGQKVYLDTSNFDSYDPKYAIGGIRDALSRAGALLMPDAKSADIIMEARSGALSTDFDTFLIGVPQTGLPVPLSGELAIPEIAFYKSVKQRSYAKFALLAYSSQSRAHIYSSGPIVGKAHDSDYKLLFVAWRRTDIPEKQKSIKKEEKYDVWFPQYDLTNMPPILQATNKPLTAPSANSAINTIPRGNTNSVPMANTNSAPTGNTVTNANP